jgi:hypothetical protein
VNLSFSSVRSNLFSLRFLVWAPLLLTCLVLPFAEPRVFSHMGCVPDSSVFFVGFGISCEE